LLSFGHYLVKLNAPFIVPRPLTGMVVTLLATGWCAPWRRTGI